MLELAAEDETGERHIAARASKKAPKLPGGSIRISQFRGPPLRISMPSREEQRPSITVEDLSHMQVCANLSNQQTCAIASTLNASARIPLRSGLGSFARYTQPYTQRGKHRMLSY